MSIAGKKQKWSEERRKLLSASMKRAAKEHPESYSASNINGRSKKIQYNGFLMDSSWEFQVAKWLDLHEIKWTKKVKGFDYEWNGSRVYYPDFYLPDLDLYVEVKGYERERDRCKWRVVKNLVVIKERF